jgi:ABC-type branched-subunit amino acid transport system ATPase component
VHRALRLADTSMVMRRGKVVWVGPSDQASAQALEHYLGDGALHVAEAEQ